MDSFLARRPWVPYVVPMAAYLAFLQVQDSWPGGLEVWYPVKVFVVAGLLWTFRRCYVELSRSSWCSGASMKRRPLSETTQPAAHEPSPQDAVLRRATATTYLLAVLTGLVAIVIWIAIDSFYLKQSELMRVLESVSRKLQGLAPAKHQVVPPFDPHTLGSAARLWTFVVFRVTGAVLVVPVMEELFWRGFLIRWLAAEDFRSVPVGTYTVASFWITVALFGMIHEQWLAGLICGALYNLLLYRTKNLTACVIAHAVSNAALAGWVLARGDWKFW